MSKKAVAVPVDCSLRCSSPIWQPLPLQNPPPPLAKHQRTLLPNVIQAYPCKQTPYDRPQYDTFKLEEAADGCALSCLSFCLLKRSGIIDLFGINEVRLVRWEGFVLLVSAVETLVSSRDGLGGILCVA